MRLRATGLEAPVGLFAVALFGSLLANPDRVADVGSILSKKLAFLVSFVVLLYLLVSVVRELEGPDRQGFNRVSWDLRYPLTFKPAESDEGWFGPPKGTFVLPGEYTVKLVSGSFEKKAAATVSRGPYLSVKIEVNGVPHGPSTIVSRSYDPEWNYAFPRPVRWKTGDSVRVVVVDNYYWKRTVSDETFEGPLAMRKLTGELPVKYGRVTFATDFKMPVLPKAE